MKDDQRLIEDAAVCSQQEILLDNESVNECIVLNVCAPLRARIAELEASHDYHEDLEHVLTDAAKLLLGIGEVEEVDAFGDGPTLADGVRQLIEARNALRRKNKRLEETAQRLREKMRQLEFVHYRKIEWKGA